MPRLLPLLSVVGILLSLGSTGLVQASCGAPRSFTSVEDHLSKYSYIFTPGFPFFDPAIDSERSTSPELDGVFWSFGGGDPSVSIGNDMGTFGPFAPTGSSGQYAAWIYTGYSGPAGLYPALIYNPGGYNHWADPRIDGCIDLDGSDGLQLDPQQCMVVLLTDQANGSGYFALIGESVQPSGNYFLNRAADNGPIVLSAIPPPTIVGFVAGDVEIDIDFPAGPTDGLYLGCEPSQNDSLPVGFRIYRQCVSSGNPAPLDRSIGSGWTGPVAEGTAGSTVVVPLGCPEDAYIAASLYFESGFETPVVSENTVACGCTGSDLDGDGFCSGGSCLPDCDDSNPAIFPFAPEICDGLNNNCKDPAWPAFPQAEIDDDDTDGFTNACDTCPTVFNPSQLDTDQDSVGNSCDNCVLEPNPLQLDQDADLRGDACDNCPMTGNTDQADQDSDLVGDACDNCLIVANSAQTDTDMDGSGDACDPCPEDVPDDPDGDGICTGNDFNAPKTGTNDNCPAAFNPGQIDMDVDGFGDACDNCPGVPNLSQVDLDDDGIGDACDNCPAVPSPVQSDADADTVGDICDNCPQTENLDQADVDSDGAGNVCDNCPDDFNLLQDDFDADAIGDVCDNCALDPNPSQEDEDLDLSGDACDNCPVIANMAQDDLDEDGIGDACDNCALNSNSSQSDSDGDTEGDHCDLDDGIIYIVFSMDPNRVEWQDEIGFDTWNSYRGDLSILRSSGVYTQSPGSNPLAAQTCGLPDPWVEDLNPVAPNAAAFYLTTGVAGGVESDLGRDGDSVLRPNLNPCP